MEEEDEVKEDEGRKAWLTQEQGEQDKSSQENREETWQIKPGEKRGKRDRTTWRAFEND